ncbi:response regulator transcription factor [Thioclava sp. BHET1]|uniref:Chemotaxis protein CheY n=1 Tax=Thioclava dalianensis TaxID=1185766 RepID=A0A074TKJ8_9RHOB|nr:response regulator transcription factor [Thioclava dalianensis]KEP70685.1 chemotaxis protein CheY [Thioclava dalianensis]TMV91384.1 response regulator transcription factor [Thioclava sp. BHET1]SFN04987.1 two-component system, OmpR family, phosphate regulon response regulator OmpR [Thioclava dalianensis]
MPHQAAPHLLIIDDDERIRTLLKGFLQRNEFLVTAARDAAHARRLLAGLDFNLIVMDVMMPGEDGLSLTRDLRKTLSTPILLLTARGDTRERIEGLEAGADDYLAKPFEPKELLLRINAILRRVPRAAETGPKFISLGALRYDQDRGELWNGETPVRLTATEVQLMKIFASHAGDVVSRSELIEELGRDRAVSDEGGGDRAIDVQITRLRRKIESDPREPRYLQTVRGLGYMLAPD